MKKVFILLSSVLFSIVTIAQTPTVLDHKIGWNTGLSDGTQRGLWLWNTVDSNHVIYSSASTGISPAGSNAADGLWDTGHRLRLRTALNQGFLFENKDEVALVDIDSDNGNIRSKGIAHFEGTGNNYFNGNVGIGTTNPGFQLHLKDPIGGAALGLERGGKLWRFDVAYNAASRLYIGHTDRPNLLTLTDQGFIGIGTTDPQRLFHISSHDPQIIISETDRPSDSKNWAFRIINDEFVLDAGNDALTAGSRVFSIKRSGLNVESFSFLNGNIGIGTNPEDRLHLIGTNPTLRLSSSAYYGGAGGAKNTVLSTIKFSNRDDNHSYRAEIRGLLTGDWAEFVGLAFTTNSAGQQLERMRINHDGTVGIGTENTFGYKLAVNGTIGATEVKVENTSAWPDFVFEKNYELRTLEEVEKHIKENGHLPEIPTEAEVTENGINLGEMNAKLLQKIEELTLYLIEEHKTTKKLTEEVELLKQELSELKGE